MQPDPKMERTLHFAFVMEQHLGHRTFYQNLRRFTEGLPGVDANWVEITYASSGSRLARLPFLPGSVRSAFAGRSQVIQGLKQKAYDVAFYNTQVPAALLGGRVRQRPYVLCTDITPIQYDEMGLGYGHQPDRDGLLSAYKRRANTRLFRNAAYVVPWSTWARSSLIEHYGVDPRRIVVIPPGVDTEVWKPGETRSSGACNVLFVGGDFERKGGRLLLDAYRRLPAGVCQLNIVTKTPLEPEPGLRVYRDLSPNSKELIALYQSCDIFAIPSKAEAFGIAAVEASATGMPVLASRVGGLGDILVEGETGFFVGTADAQALAGTLRCLAENEGLRRKIGTAGRNHVLSHFDARVNAGRIIDLLKSARRSDIRLAQTVKGLS